MTFEDEIAQDLRREDTAIACLLSPGLLRNMFYDRHREVVPLEETDFQGYCGADDETRIYRREGVDYLLQPVNETEDDSYGSFTRHLGIRIEAYAEDVQCFAAEDSGEWGTY